MAYTPEERFALNSALERIRNREQSQAPTEEAEANRRDLGVIHDLITLRLEAEVPHEAATLAEAALYLRYLGAAYHRLHQEEQASVCYTRLLAVQAERVAQGSLDSEALADDLLAAAVLPKAYWDALSAPAAPILGEETLCAILSFTQQNRPNL